MTEQANQREVIIIGSGPAGLTAAIYTARGNLSPLLIHGPLPGGQLTTTTEVENFPGFPDGIMGPELMEKMEAQAKRFGTEVIVDSVVKVDITQSPFTLETEGGRAFDTKTLIIATGATPRLLGVPGERELMGFGVSTCATCDGAFFRDKVIAVIGGGDSACEEAAFLTRFGSKVFLIHRRGELRASKIMQERVFSNKKIEVLWHRNLKEVVGTKESGVTALILVDPRSSEEHTVKVDGVFIAIGHTPNSQLLKGQLELDENGYVIAEPGRAATSVEGVFVCGDVQDHRYRQAITAAGSGCMAALEAERWLENH